ncbi:hypothetical protein [Ramlibacter sp.]|uniref:hypothetical protein n=1 Tax=Ramlibacter sp. TaxID=1917967 RepID=UPI0026320570|nr:hypothetical protein [Ramlibacter sp.]
MRTTVAIAAATALAANAQQVKLRLANSLCTSMTNQALASQLVPPLSSSAAAGSMVNSDLAQRMEEQRQGFFSRLDGLVPFNGLYAVGQADQSFQENFGARYSFGLEWELYKEGRGESRRALERQRLENKTQYLQVLRDTEQRQLQEQLLAVEQMRTKLLAVLYQREVEAVRPVLERRQQELAAGRATKFELAEIQFKAERAALRAQHYGSTPDVLVYPQAQELINRIEDVQLRPTPELTDLAFERSPEVQLQTLLADRAALLPTMRDETTVRFYLERNKDFDRASFNAAGVRVRIPIGNDRARDAVVESSRELYDQQKESLRAALSQRIAMLTERLRLKQNDMRLLQAENRMIRQKAELACYRLDHPVTSLPDSDREVEELTLRLVGLQREILSARLDVLEVLTQISALVKPREPQELYSLADPQR